MLLGDLIRTLEPHIRVRIVFYEGEAIEDKVLGIRGLFETPEGAFLEDEIVEHIILSGEKIVVYIS